MINTIDIQKIVAKIPKGKRFIFRGENKRYEKISSTLYREQKKVLVEIDKELLKQNLDNLDFPIIQEEIIKKAKRHFKHNESNLEILSYIQHYRGKTNLIDFSKNFLIALFFACDGNIDKDGRLICLDVKDLKKATEIDEGNFRENLLLEPNSKDSRPIFQQSIFVYDTKGFISKDEATIIPIPKKAKQGLLKELDKYYGINTESIYNDLQGFIQNNDNYKTAETYFYMGLSCIEKGAHKEAIKYFDKAIKLKPNNANAYNNKGVALLHMKEYEKAIKCYDKAIALNLNDANAYGNKGVALFHMKKYEEAIMCYDKAL